MSSRHINLRELANILWTNRFSMTLLATQEKIGTFLGDLNDALDSDFPPTYQRSGTGMDDRHGVCKSLCHPANSMAGSFPGQQQTHLLLMQLQPGIQHFGTLR